MRPTLLLSALLLSIGLAGACTDQPTDPSTQPTMATVDPDIEYCENGYQYTYTYFNNYQTTDLYIDWETGSGTKTMTADCHIGYPYTPRYVGMCRAQMFTQSYGAFWDPANPFYTGEGLTCFPTNNTHIMRPDLGGM